MSSALSANVRPMLLKEGWRTPDTYSNDFEPITAIPAVYLFLLVDQSDYLTEFVAYVGMSANLKQRMQRHETKPQIGKDGHWLMTWFKPTPEQSLREIEAKYIKRFNPPWNIIGRTRGLVA